MRDARRRMIGLAALALAATAGAALTSCRSAAEEAERIAARPGHAVCVVCQCDGDLGCMDVEVGPRTPRAELDGRTHYFCSETCRAAFLRNPYAYAGSIDRETPR